MLGPAQPGKGMHVRFFEELKRRYAIRMAGLLADINGCQRKRGLSGQ
jgi:hypothetical protein